MRTLTFWDMVRSVPYIKVLRARGVRISNSHLQYGTGRCRGQEVAVKVPKKQKLTMAELTSFRNEVKIMRYASHNNIIYSRTC
jgi:serine/threonine protein kinase